MKIASVNVRGLRKRKKRLSVFRQLKRQKCQIILLQETYVNKNDVKQWSNEWGGLIYANCYTNNSRGLVVLFQNRLDVQCDEIQGEYESRIQNITCKIENEEWRIVNLYAPNGERESVFL